jgi:hypothetical protein
MPEDWIGQKYRKFQQNVAERNKKDSWAVNAQNSYGTLFQRLQDRVESDVKEHNRLFGASLNFDPLQVGFSVRNGGNETIIVRRATSGTVIQIERSLVGKKQPVSDHLDISPDENGNIRYFHNGVPLDDVSDASEIIFGQFVVV